MNDVFSISNRAVAAGATSLHLPSVEPPPEPPGESVEGGYQYVGGSTPAPSSVPGVPSMFTNRLGSNQPVISWTVKGPSLKGRWLGAPGGDSADVGGVSLPPDSKPKSPLARGATANTRVTEPDADVMSLLGIYKQIVDKGRGLVHRAAYVLYEIPWYLLLLLIAALFELRRRAKARHRAIVHHSLASRLS